jgi:uncharacterized lipoprotein YbaY
MRHWRKWILGLFVLALMASPAMQAEKKTVKTIKEWSGTVDDTALMKEAPGSITSIKELEKLWEAWKINDPMPTVDFAKELVVVSTTQGSRLRLALVLDDGSGNLTVGGVGTRDLRPGFRYVIGTVSLEGVKTVNGKELISENKQSAAKVTGTIESQEKTQFGPDTIATVELQDTSRADAKASPIATQTIKGLKQFPVPFELSYDPQAIKPGSRYTLRARITTKQRLDYTNDTSVPVLTAGNPTKDVKIPVVRVKR